MTISGDAGDRFDDFDVGPHQVVRDFWYNVWWGTGDNRTHRTSEVKTPIRDVSQHGTIWYDDSKVDAKFAASGDPRLTGMDDWPGATNIPFENPVAVRQSTEGWFNWGMAFVTYISAHDASKGEGADAFQALAHVYWNLSLAGRFDTTKPKGRRITIDGGGKVNIAGPFEGASTEFPSMHGGTHFNLEADAAEMTR